MNPELQALLDALKALLPEAKDEVLQILKDQVSADTVARLKQSAGLLLHAEDANQRAEILETIALDIRNETVDVFHEVEPVALSLGQAVLKVVIPMAFAAV